MIKIHIMATPEGIEAIRQRLVLAGEGGEMVPMPNILRVVTDLLDKKADVVAENPIMLARNTTFSFELQVFP